MEGGPEPRISILNYLKCPISRNSLAVQQLELCAHTAEGLGSIPGQGTKIHGQEKKKEKKKEKRKLCTRVKYVSTEWPSILLCGL